MATPAKATHYGLYASNIGLTGPAMCIKNKYVLQYLDKVDNDIFAAVRCDACGITLYYYTFNNFPDATISCCDRQIIINCDYEQKNKIEKFEHIIASKNDNSLRTLC